MQAASGKRQAASGRSVAGARDNGTPGLAPGARSEKSGSWFGGDGGWCASDPRVFYGEYVFLNMHRNSDACATSDA